ncbi:MAG: alginate export family protein [Candidatus Omnitrophota bacterium]
MKLFKVLCVLALVFAVSTIAYAETQSVKVSGDIALRAFARNNYDLDNDDPGVLVGTGGGALNVGSMSSDWATYLLNTAEVQIDADLTDNVSGVIRLINQRTWGDPISQEVPSEDNNFTTVIRDADGNLESSTRYLARTELGAVDLPFPDQVVDRQVNTLSDGRDFKVDVDLAYIELKEFLYSPLTLRIGRQDLWFGKGFIIGANLQDPQNSLFCPEYTAIRSFDAIRATLDYDPWTIDGVFAKIREAFRRSDDDINLWGINVGYIFDEYNAEAETYWWYKNNRYVGRSGASKLITVRNGAQTNDVFTWGGRGSFDPIEDWTVALEAAYQHGEYVGANNQIERRPRSAWALDAMVECRYWQDDFAWRPVVGVEYIFYSGEQNMGNVNALTGGTYNGWDRMYRGKFDTAIREFQNVFYRTRQVSSPSFTNQHQLLVRGTLEPTDSLTFDAIYGHFWLDEIWSQRGGVVPENKKRNVGDELDLSLTWDYTEDVQFNLLAAWFWPGDHFVGGLSDTATDIVTSVKLSF